MRVETLHEAPIKDKTHVDQRRPELGLMRVDLYARLTAKMMPQFCPSLTPKRKRLGEPGEIDMCLGNL